MFDVPVPSGPDHLAFTDDGRRLIVGGAHFLSLVDVVTGHVLFQTTANERPIAVSRAGRVALLQTGPGLPRLVDLADRREIGLEHNFSPLRAEFSGDDRYLLAWLLRLSYAAVIVFDATNGRELFRVEHGGETKTAAFSSDSRYLATASPARTLVHRIDDGRQVLALAGSVDSLHFTPDNMRLTMVPYGSGRLTFFSVASGQAVHSLRLEGGAIQFSADAELMAIDGRVVSTETGMVLLRAKSALNCVSLSRDGTLLLAAGEGGVELAEVAIPSKPSLPCLSGDFTADGSRLLCRSLGTSLVIDTATWKRLPGWERELSWFAKLGNRGRFAVTTSVGASFDLVDTSSKKVLWTSPSITKWITFSANDTLVAFSGGIDTYVVQSATGREVAVFHSPSNVTAHAFSRNESLIAIASEDGIVRIFDAVTGRQRIQIAQNARVYGLAFGPGNILAAGTEAGALRIFNASGREMTHVPYPIPVVSLQFSQSGRYILTLGVRPKSEWRTARIFDVSRMRELWAANISMVNDPAAVSFAADDRVVVSYTGFELQRHAWHADDLIAEACSRLDRNMTPIEWRQYLGDEPYRKTCPTVR